MPTYQNRAQYGKQDFEWDPQQRLFSGNIQENSPGFLTELLGRLDRQDQLQPWETEELAQWQAQARAIPTRDIAGLTAQWQGEDRGGDFDEQGNWRPYDQQWWSRLDPGSPDAGPIMLSLRDKMQAGTATEQERALYDKTLGMAQDWNVRASVPQASDANPFGLGDNLFGALMTVGLGATGGLAGGALAAGTAGLGSTLGSLGTLAGVAGTGAGMVGQATDQDWLSKLGLGLGIAGGLAGGIGGLASLWSSGVGSLSDAARLAQSAGKITGALGRIPGADPLKDVSRYLGYAGQAGQFGAGIGADDWLGWRGTNAAEAANVAPQVGGNVRNLLSAADVATQRGGGMSEWDYSEPIGPGLGWDASPDYGGGWSGYDAPIGPGLGWDAGGYPTGDTGYTVNPTQYTSPIGPGLLPGDPTSGGSGGVWGTLGSLGSGALKMLLGSAGGASSGGLLGGGSGGILGPLLASLGSVGGGAIGSNAANDAARLQSQALNRGIDLQTAQWLQQQQNLAPYLQAGQQGLSTLQGLAGREQPGLPGATPAFTNAGVPLPSVMPGWTPRDYQGPQSPQAGDYRWTPGQGPQAANYRYTPGQTPDAAAYRSGPPQLYQGAMPGTQVPTLTGQQVLDQDPGAAFRQTEARRALEGSAAARGELLSGGTLQALQSRSQDLASQEYQNAWQRMMARNTEQYGRDWGQYQQAWSQGIQGTQLGLATNAQNFGQALSAAQLREQVNQVASQQGWSQAQTEAVFREQMAQQASQQGFTQALAGQQNQFSQGLQADQWSQRQRQQFETDLYGRLMQQNQLQYGRDVYGNETDYTRQQALYRQQLGQFLLPWEQSSTLATLGGQATGMYGQQGQGATNAISNLLTQQGQAQAGGATNQANSWMNALQNVGNAGQGYLQNQSLLSALSKLNA